MSTSTMAIPFKGIRAKYGSGKQLSFDAKLVDTYSFNVDEVEQKMNCKADVNLKMFVILDGTRELAAEWDLLNIKVNFTATADDKELRGHLHEVHFDLIKQNYSSFGKIDNILLRNLANTYFSNE